MISWIGILIFVIFNHFSLWVDNVKNKQTMSVVLILVGFCPNKVNPFLVHQPLPVQTKTPKISEVISAEVGLCHGSVKNVDAMTRLPGLESILRSLNLCVTQCPFL